eukprot:jgi/Tetstr1/461088/TSEL_006232.t1
MPRSWRLVAPSERAVTAALEEPVASGNLIHTLDVPNATHINTLKSVTNIDTVAQKFSALLAPRDLYEELHRSSEEGREKEQEYGRPYEIINLVDAIHVEEHWQKLGTEMRLRVNIQMTGGGLKRRRHAAVGPLLPLCALLAPAIAR